MITISIILQRWKKKRIIVSVRLDERYQKRILKFINRVHVGVSSCNLVLELIGQVCLIINPYNKFARLLLTCITHGNNTFNNLLWLGIFILGSIRWRENTLFFSSVSDSSKSKGKATRLVSLLCFPHLWDLDSRESEVLHFVCLPVWMALCCSVC